MSVPSTEVRRAWEQHDPSRRHPRIGPEQRGLLRAFKNSLAPAARLVDVIRSDTYRRARDDYAFKKGIGRSRALARLNHQLVPPAILMAKNEDAAIWSWLKAGGPVIADSEDPGHAQDCVLVYVAISGRSNDGQAATAG